jgi:hypothetical protein
LAEGDERNSLEVHGASAPEPLPLGSACGVQIWNRLALSFVSGKDDLQSHSPDATRLGPSFFITRSSREPGSLKPPDRTPKQ